jgi:PLP dependent protein
MTNIQDNFKNIKEAVSQAAIRSGRQPHDILIVAATKEVPPEKIIEAVSAGLTEIGENRVQEAFSKVQMLSKYPLKWHLIGHLQTNKVKQALKIFSVIQSVDSQRLAKEISDKADRDIEIFIEVNTSGEASKFGILPENTLELVKYSSALPHIKVTGLMTIGPNTQEDRVVRAGFRQLKALFDSINALKLPGIELKYLSMGMSSDFSVAIEEGSNLVRVGRAIFPSCR